MSSKKNVFVLYSLLANSPPRIFRSRATVKKYMASDPNLSFFEFKSIEQAQSYIKKLQNADNPEETTSTTEDSQEILNKGKGKKQKQSKAPKGKAKKTAKIKQQQNFRKIKEQLDMGMSFNKQINSKLLQLKEEKPVVEKKKKIQRKVNNLSDIEKNIINQAAQNMKEKQNMKAQQKIEDIKDVFEVQQDQKKQINQEQGRQIEKKTEKLFILLEEKGKTKQKDKKIQQPLTKQEKQKEKEEIKSEEEFIFSLPKQQHSQQLSNIFQTNFKIINSINDLQSQPLQNNSGKNNQDTQNSKSINQHQSMPKYQQNYQHQSLQNDQQQVQQALEQTLETKQKKQFIELKPNDLSAMQVNQLLNQIQTKYKWYKPTNLSCQGNTMSVKIGYHRRQNMGLTHGIYQLDNQLNRSQKNEFRIGQTRNSQGKLLTTVKILADLINSGMRNPVKVYMMEEELEKARVSMDSQIIKAISVIDRLKGRAFEVY